MANELHAVRPGRQHLVIVGNGMATSKLLDELLAHDAQRVWDVTVIGEEPHGAYNRILLGKILAGAQPDDISLKDHAWYAKQGITLYSSVRAQRLLLRERGHAGEVKLSNGKRLAFDKLVLATGSRALVPPIDGLRQDDALLEGAFVFRTIDDGLALRSFARPGMQAVVLGGGVLGLEAAKALHDLGLEVTIVDRAAGPMARQLDAVGSATLAARFARQGIRCIGNAGVHRITGDQQVQGVVLDSGQELPCQVLGLACGIRPRVELVRGSGISVNRAIVVDDWLEVVGVSNVFAVGECAEHRGVIYGIVAPIWEQVSVLADVLLERPTAGFQGAQSYLRLKGAGTDVASLGVVEGDAKLDEVVVVEQRQRASYCKLVIRDNRLIGAQLVGDVTPSAQLVTAWQRKDPLPENRLDLLCSTDMRSSAGSSGAREICNCNRVNEDKVLQAIKAGHVTLPALGNATGAGTGCGSCKGELERLVAAHAPAERQPLAAS